MSSTPSQQSQASGSARFQTLLRHAWERRGLLACLLWPLSKVYGAIYQRSQKRIQPQHAGIPTIVVGNVIAGGAGKTPVTQAIVQHLLNQGCHPGIVSRGYGRSTKDCRAVHLHDDALLVGDEPLLLAQSTGVPVFVASQRIEAARALRAQHPEVDVLVCDDGLQHVALARDVQVCVFHEGGIGNGWLLPAGPLREPWPKAVDAVLYAGGRPVHTPAQQASFAISRRLADYAVRSDGARVPLTDLHGVPLHAVAAIARPERFFSMLQSQGLHLERCEALPDHYNFESFPSTQNQHEVLICTEKDAVKLWSIRPDALAVPLVVDIPQAFFDLLDARLSLSSGTR